MNGISDRDLIAAFIAALLGQTNIDSAALLRGMRNALQEFDPSIADDAMEQIIAGRYRPQAPPTSR